MVKKTKSLEYEHFNNLADEWWSENGKYKILHEIKSVRIKYILDQLKVKKINNFNVLDLGCGGGLVCEPLARLGGNITGIDFVENNIKAAKIHALQNDLKINYLNQSIEKLNLKKKYDLILMFEVLEHLENWEKAIKDIKQNLKRNGIIIFSTINRNVLSKILVIKLAENILKWIPRNTHDFNKLIKPEELNTLLIKENFSILNFSGLIFNPIDRKWKLSQHNKLLNYFCTAKLN